MKWFIVLVISLIILSACGMKPYVEGGLSVHSQSAARPEVKFPNPTLGYAEAGATKNGWDIYVRHVSDPASFEEKGHGINSVGACKRIVFQ